MNNEKCPPPDMEKLLNKQGEYDDGKFNDLFRSRLLEEKDTKRSEENIIEDEVISKSQIKSSVPRKMAEGSIELTLEDLNDDE